MLVIKVNVKIYTLKTMLAYMNRSIKIVTCFSIDLNHKSKSNTAKQGYILINENRRVTKSFLTTGNLLAFGRLANCTCSYDGALGKFSKRVKFWLLHCKQHCSNIPKMSVKDYTISIIACRLYTIRAM